MKRAAGRAEALGRAKRGEVMMRILDAMVMGARPMGAHEIADTIDWDTKDVHAPLVALENASLVARAGVVPRAGKPGRAPLMWVCTPVAQVIVRLPALPEREQLKLVAIMAVWADRSAAELALAVGQERTTVSGRLRRMRERGLVKIVESKGDTVRWRWRLAEVNGSAE